MKRHPTENKQIFEIVSGKEPVNWLQADYCDFCGDFFDAIARHMGTFHHCVHFVCLKCKTRKFSINAAPVRHIFEDHYESDNEKQPRCSLCAYHLRLCLEFYFFLFYSLILSTKLNSFKLTEMKYVVLSDNLIRL